MVAYEVLKHPHPAPPYNRGPVTCRRCSAVLHNSGGGHNAEAARNEGWSIPAGDRRRAICPKCLRGDVPDGRWAEQANADLLYRKQRLARERRDRAIAEEVWAVGRRKLTAEQEAAIARAGVVESFLGRYS